MRPRVCAKEVWVDILKRDERDFHNQLIPRAKSGKAMKLAGYVNGPDVRHPKFGKQRGFRPE